MRVDFYQLSRDPAESVVPQIARNTLGAGERLLVVSADPAQLERISAALWQAPKEAFLAHGRAGGAHDARQPILLSDRADPANGAHYLAIADGEWREGEAAFARTFHFFDDATVVKARETWRMLKARDGAKCYYWAQDGGKWVQKA